MNDISSKNTESLTYPAYYFAKKVLSAKDKEKKEKRNLYKGAIEEELTKYKDQEIPKISSLDVSPSTEPGIYKIDFGETFIPAYIDGEETVLFTLKLADDRDEIKTVLLPLSKNYKKKEEPTIIEALDLLSPGFKKRAAVEKKDGELYEFIADKLNSFTKTSHIKVEQRDSYIKLRPQKFMDKDVAKDNLEEVESSFWKELIIGFDSDNASPSQIDAFSEKMKARIESSDIKDENPYITVQSGNKFFSGVENFIEELEEENPELLSKITKGGADEDKVQIKKVIKTTTISKPERGLIEFLQKKYNDTNKYRALIRAEEQEEKSSFYVGDRPLLK